MLITLKACQLLCNHMASITHIIYFTTIFYSDTIISPRSVKRHDCKYNHILNMIYHLSNEADAFKRETCHSAMPEPRLIPKSCTSIPICIRIV